MTVAFGSIGTGRAVGGTTLVPGSVALTGTDIPASDAAGNGKIAWIFWANSTDAEVLYDAATWTFLGDVEGGDGSFGVDSGLRHISAYWTTANLTGTTQTFTLSGAADPANLIGGYIHRFTKTLTYWDTPQLAEAPFNTPGVAFSATFNRDPGGEAGDMTGLCLVANTDAVNPAALTLTWPGTTGTSTARATSPYSQGNDIRVVVRDRDVATGPSSAAPSVTSSTTFTGAAMLVRLRDTNVAPTAVPVANAGGDTVAEPYLPGAVTLDGSASSYSPGATFLWEHISGGTGTVDIDDDSVLEAVATVTPTVRADEDYTFRLTVTDSGGSDADDKVVTVLRATESTGAGAPRHLTLGG